MGKSAAKKHLRRKQYYSLPINADWLKPTGASAGLKSNELVLVTEITPAVIGYISAEIRRAILNGNPQGVKFYERLRSLVFTEIQRKKLGRNYRGFQELLKEAIAYASA